MQEQNIVINLSDIGTIQGLPDRELDAQHVAALVATNEPDKWPPIIVAPINGKYGRIAGKHRIEAAKKLGLKRLPAIARYYPDKTAMYIDMWEDNVRNGKPLTTKERKEYAVGLHKVQPSLSLREIGRRAGLPHPTVKAAIQATQETPDENASEQARYNYGMNDYAGRVRSALDKFLIHERALLGAIDGKRSENVRAKLLAGKMAANEENIRAMLSLSRTFNETANILTKEMQG